jgi:hypothetical protein
VLNSWKRPVCNSVRQPRCRPFDRLYARASRPTTSMIWPMTLWACWTLRHRQGALRRRIVRRHDLSAGGDSTSVQSADAHVVHLHPRVPDVAHAVKGSDGDAAADLPAPSASMLEQVRTWATVDWTDEAAATEAFVVEARAMAGSRYRVDEAEVRAWAPVEYNRQNNILSFRLNTPIAETRTPAWRGGLGTSRRRRWSFTGRRTRYFRTHTPLRWPTRSRARHF